MMFLEFMKQRHDVTLNGLHCHAIGLPPPVNSNIKQCSS